MFEERWQLQRPLVRGSRPDLHDYVFRDDLHAREWLSQSFVKDEDYKVRRVLVDTAPCKSCGGTKEHVVKILSKEKNPSEIL